MNRTEKLKQELGNRYVYERYISDEDVNAIMKLNHEHFDFAEVASLIAGCMKIEAVLYRKDRKMNMGYDIFVKDKPDAKEWICYDSLNENARPDEDNMLTVLDRAVHDNGLSYTKCCFEKVNGKVLGKKKETEVHENG